MNLTVKQAFEMLKEIDNILILTHRNPDGDAVGSMFALYYVLKSMGKNVGCMSDKIPDSLSFPVCKEAFEELEAEYIISTDVADAQLFTDAALNKYGDKIFLSIDHHASSKPFAENTLVDPEASAACEVICDMLIENEFPISKEIANSLYLGIATDTGCFRYSNTTAKTLSFAARLIENGADNAEINRIVFETKSLQLIRFEALAANSLRTYYDGKCAVLVITRDMYKRTGISEAETHGIAALPRQVEGVLAGIVIKERDVGKYKISIRSNEPVSAAEICEVFGGGGHKLAAGCELSGNLQSVINSVLKVTGEVLKDI